VIKNEGDLDVETCRQKLNGTQTSAGEETIGKQNQQ